MEKLKQFLLILWQLPQYLLGLSLIKITKAVRRVTSGYVWYYFDRAGGFNRFFSGVSLASIILLPYEDLTVIKHERGHSKQSLILGWLYLPVVGIYSAVFCNLWDRRFHTKWNLYDRAYWYYKLRWTERWADKLGGVDRDSVLCEVCRPPNSKYPAINVRST